MEENFNLHKVEEQSFNLTSYDQHKTFSLKGQNITN
jgi:hypothetical protein